MSESGLDKVPLRTLEQARADRAKAQKARQCVDCPGPQSLMCCGRTRAPANEDGSMWDGNGRPML